MKEPRLRRDRKLEEEMATMLKGLPLASLVDMPVPSGVDTVTMEKLHTTEPQVIVCPRCGSQDTMKYGVRNDAQEYICRGCGRKFNTKDAPLGMQTPTAQIGAALAMFYDGLSCADIARQIEQSGGVVVNPSTVYRWVQRYTRQAIDKTTEFRARTGKIWAADETVLGVHGGRTKEGAENTSWFWDVICEDTRFLLASHLSQTRTIKDATTLFSQARERSLTAPRFIITDKLRAYLEGIERVFGGETTHVQSQGMATSTHNNIIERFHGTIKERTKVMRDLKSPESAKLIMSGWAVHYNFFRPHMSLHGKTPAEAAGIKAGCKTWTDVVRDT
jgi:transposase-like protein/predicted RNA-binding Zn-ribbon protein involved in translation (DUF1610 family)